MSPRRAFLLGAAVGGFFGILGGLWSVIAFLGGARLGR